MNTPNYEAIGRYITASKAAKAAAQTRNAKRSTGWRWW